MGRYFAAPSGRFGRQSARRGLRLADLGISKQTQNRYYVAVRRLLPKIDGSLSMEQLDEIIAEWIEERFSKGEPLNNVADALSGLQYFLPACRRRLVASWKLFSVWRRYEVPSRAPPITTDLSISMASCCLQEGAFEMGTLLLLGFHCMLRTGELLQLRISDLLVSDVTGIVHLRSSKSGLRHNTKESVTIDSPMVRAVCLELVERRRVSPYRNLPIWRFSGTHFRKEFSRLCERFHVLHLNFRPYSLRRGGATAFFMGCGLMEKTLIKGRWASSSVARIYLCDSLAQLPVLKGTKETQELITKFLPFLSS